MARKIHPDRFVTFLRPHVEVTPATVLESTDFKGVTYKIADIPERRETYTVGQELRFGSVNAARAFVKAINEGANEPICRIGKNVT